MAATYSHKGKGSADYRPRTSIFQKPEPLKMYSIGGLTVDEATYRKYNREDYRLGDGVFRNLRGVMLYAESAELAANYPETAEAAKKIIAEITAEITGKGAENTMNNPITAKAVSDGSRELNVYDQANAVLRQALREDQKSAEWFASHVERDWGTFQTAMDEFDGSSVESAE